MEKQKTVLLIENDDVFEDKQLQKHGVLFGDRGSKRGLSVGGSGCGKTNVLLYCISLLEHPIGLRFENIYLYSKTL